MRGVSPLGEALLSSDKRAQKLAWKPMVSKNFPCSTQCRLLLTGAEMLSNFSINLVVAADVVRHRWISTLVPPCTLVSRNCQYPHKPGAFAVNEKDSSATEQKRQRGKKGILYALPAPDIRSGHLVQRKEVRNLGSGDLWYFPSLESTAPQAGKIFVKNG